MIFKNCVFFEKNEILIESCDGLLNEMFGIELWGDGRNVGFLNSGFGGNLMR